MKLFGLTLKKELVPFELESFGIFFEKIQQSYIVQQPRDIKIRNLFLIKKHISELYRTFP